MDEQNKKNLDRRGARSAPEITRPIGEATRMSTSENLWTTGEIARHLGVDSSTVSNYRRRFAGDFPAPRTVAGSSRPHFDRAEVIAWLERNPQVGSGETRKTRPDAAVMIAVDLLRQHGRTEEVEDIIGAMLVALEAEDQRGAVAAGLGNANEIRNAVVAAGDALNDSYGQRSLDHLPDRVVTEVWAFLTSVRDRLAAYDQVLRSRSELGVTRTGDALARFLLALTPETGGFLFDPAAGIGEVLRAALIEGVADDGAGADINGRVVSTANRRLFLSHLSQRIYGHDSLRMPDEASLFPSDGEVPSADLVVIDSPLGAVGPRHLRELDRRWIFEPPTASSSDLAWLDVALSLLKPSGRALVVTTAAALFRRDASTDRIRHEIVRRGALEAVIALPRGAREDASVRIAVWVLRAPDRVDRRSTVLLVNAPNVLAEALAPDGAAANAVREWLRDEAANADPGTAVAVPVTDLLAPDATLLPNRWTETPVETVSPRTWTDRLETTYQEAARAIKRLPALPTAHFEPDESAYRRIKIGELLSSGTAELVRGRYIERTDQATGRLRMLNVRIARQGAALESDELEFVADTPATRPQLVRPGDVLIYPDGDRVAATVWNEEGWVLGRFMQSLRLTDQFWNREYVAASLASSANARFLIELTSRTNFHLEEFELLARPLKDQERLAALADALTTLDRLSADANQRVREARRLLLDGFSSGVVDVRVT